MHNSRVLLMQNNRFKERLKYVYEKNYIYWMITMNKAFFKSPSMYLLIYPSYQFVKLLLPSFYK